MRKSRLLPARSKALRSVINIGSIHWNATPGARSCLLLSLSFLLSIIIKFQFLGLRLVGLEKIGNILTTFEQDFNKVITKLSIFVIEERRRNAFITNTSGTTCIELEYG